MDFIIEQTPTNKTKCQICKEVLVKGEWRFKVSAISWKHSANAYFHVPCFLTYFNQLIDKASERLNNV